MTDYDSIYFALVTGIVVFSLMLGTASIVGNVTSLPSSDALREQVVQFIAKMPPSVLLTKSNACIVIEQDGYQSYEVNKSENDVLITRRYCAEDKDKDFIIKFNSYDAFLNTMNNPDDLFLNHGKDYWLFPSAKMRYGGELNCDDDLKTRYCAAAFYYYTSSEIKDKLPCCADYQLTETEKLTLDRLISGKKKTLMPTSIFGVGILVIIFSLTAIGLFISVFLVLHSKTKKKNENQKVQDLKVYVTQTLQQGYSPQQIKETLSSSGWKNEDIEEAFK